MNFPIKGFLQTSFVDWPGKIASVLFLPRCNFRCPYCHNHELILDSDRFPTVPFDYILATLRPYRGWIDGVCITGGEPTLLPSLPELVKHIKRAGMQVKLDTNGSRPMILKSLLHARLVDYVAMDVKAPLDRNAYSRCSGVGADLDAVSESISLLKTSGISYEFRVTVVPTLLDENDLVRMAHQLRGAAKLTLQQFNPTHALDPRCRTIAPFPESRIRAMQLRVNDILRENLPHKSHPFSPIGKAAAQTDHYPFNQLPPVLETRRFA